MGGVFINDIKLSVIVPVYNAENYLQKCLDSIIGQSLEDIEIICVNDGSTDGSPHILKEYSNKYNNIHVIDQNNAGAGVARNNALSLAKGRYISFIDSDDFIIDENALETMINVAIDKNADMVSANLRLYQNEKLREPKCYNEIIDEGTISPEEYGIPWYYVKNIFKRNFLDINGIKFPEYLRGQDPVFLAKALSKVDLIYTLPIDFYAYNKYDSKNTNKISSNEKQINYIKHYIDVINILKDPKFKKVKMEYIENLGYFLINQKLVLGNEIVENSLKEATSGDDLFLILFNLQTQILERNAKIKNLNLKLLNEKKKLNSLLSSNSFKITKTFRTISNTIKKLKNNYKW